MKTAAQPKFFSTSQERELACLRDLSARVGSDPLLVQASNGNTSIKLDGILWIKASGKWLARAIEDEIFVALELAEARQSVQKDAEVARHSFKEQPQPSVETPMHAILHHRVVVHVHSINALAWAIRLDGPTELRDRLAGLNWQWIPYVASGIPLAREIEKVVATAPETDVLILGNHGLVVCGEDCDAADKLLREVERRLAIAPRRFPTPDVAVLALIARFSNWRFPDVDSLHALGTDAVSRKIIRGGVLYPCQAIFLGQTMPLMPPAVALSKSSPCLNRNGKPSPFVAVERSGVMLHKGITTSERATLIALVQVTQRTEESTPLRYLKELEVANVLSKDAHTLQGAMEESANSPT